MVVKFIVLDVFQTLEHVMNSKNLAIPVLLVIQIIVMACLSIIPQLVVVPNIILLNTFLWHPCLLCFSLPLFLSLFKIIFVFFCSIKNVFFFFTFADSTKNNTKKWPLKNHSRENDKSCIHSRSLLIPFVGMVNHWTIVQMHARLTLACVVYLQTCIISNFYVGALRQWITQQTFQKYIFFIFKSSSL